MSDLPFETDAAGEDEASARPLASTVLIVDDEAVVRDVLARLLSREQDLAILEVDSAEAGLKVLGQRRIDLLVTDKNLPGVGGLELIREAKRRVPTLEAIMITGYASSESLIAAFAAGASDYLLKPFDDIQIVKAKLRSAIERGVERVHTRRRTRELAIEAESLLAGGKDASDEIWGVLDAAFQNHDATIRGEATGLVAVVDAPTVLEVLAAAGLSATAVRGDASLGDAEVIVLTTAAFEWRERATTLLDEGREVLLVAHPGAELPELLDAISLRLELIGFGTGSTELLPSRVRAALLRRGQRRAQDHLAEALAKFRMSLR